MTCQAQPCKHERTEERGFWLGPHTFGDGTVLKLTEVLYTKRCQRCHVVLKSVELRHRRSWGA